MTATRGKGGGLQLFVLYDKVRISVENFLQNELAQGDVYRVRLEALPGQ